MLTTPLSGVYQSRNAAAGFLAASKFMGFVPAPGAIKKAASNVKMNTGYFGRIETVPYKNRRFVLDVSHNPAGVLTTLKELSNHKIGTVVFGMMSDKDYKSAVDLLLKKSVRLIFTQPDYKRALNPQILLKYASGSKKLKNVYIESASSVSDAVDLSLKITPKGEEILIIGSFFLVSDALKAMGYRSLPL
jgi:folylpolyglutamate synthase/dihydropteroate synthase